MPISAPANSTSKRTLTAALESGDLEAAVAAFRQDIVFHSPILATVGDEIRGLPTLAKILQAAFTCLGMPRMWRNSKIPTATPGTDRHLSYVSMTRHREEATLYAGNDDFKDFEALKERLSRARPKDTTLDYAQRRGFEVAEEPMRKAAAREPGKRKELDLDPIERFKVTQREFIKVAGLFDLDPDACAAEARRQMSSAAEEISKDAGLMRRAERAGIVDQVKNLGSRESTRPLERKGLRAGPLSAGTAAPGSYTSRSTLRASFCATRAFRLSPERSASITRSRCTRLSILT